MSSQISQASSQTLHSRLKSWDLPLYKGVGGTLWAGSPHRTLSWPPSSVPVSSWHLSSCRVHISSVFELLNVWQCFRLLLIREDWTRHLARTLSNSSFCSLLFNSTELLFQQEKHRDKALSYWVTTAAIFLFCYLYACPFSAFACSVGLFGCVKLSLRAGLHLNVRLQSNTVQ